MKDGEPAGPALWPALRHPARGTFQLDAALGRGGPPPWGTWTGLTLVAVAGSCGYGASLSRVFPAWSAGSGALWLALSAGLAWCLLGPALVLLTRRSPWTLAHACLVTMAYGEGVLQVLAVLNLLLGKGAGPLALPLNYGGVALSNVVMAAVLTRQLQALGVPVWRTLLAWMGVLNGSGALFFWCLARVLGGR